jgi:hypothetical protein
MVQGNPMKLDNQPVIGISPIKTLIASCQHCTGRECSLLKAIPEPDEELMSDGGVTLTFGWKSKTNGVRT